MNFETETYNAFMQRRLLQSFVAAQRKFQLRDLHCAKEQLDLEIERLDTLKFDSARRKMRRPEQPGHLDSASQPATNPGRAKNNAARYVSSRDQKQNSRRKQDMQGTRDNQINSERKEPKPPSLKEFNQVRHVIFGRNHTLQIPL